MNIESLHSQIKRSIQDSSLSAVKEWVQQGADINHTDDGFMCKTKGYTLLHWAIKVENFEILRYLIDKEVSYKVKIPKVGTLLDFSVEATNLKIIAYLLQLDFSAGEKKRFIEDSIFYAGIYDQFKKIEYLVKGSYTMVSSGLIGSLKNVISRGSPLENYGFDINTKDKFGETILHRITGSKNALNTIKLLIDKGIDVEHKGDRGWTALDYAVDCKNIEVISLLKELGAKGGISKTMDEIALYEAIENDDLLYIQKYIKNGGDINIKINKKGHLKDPLLILSIENDSNLVSNFLIDKGVDISLKDELYDSTALWFAVTKGKLDIVKKLINKGDDVNTVGGGSDEGAGTILIGATFYNNVKVLQYLLDAGANINEVDAYGRTALHIARYEESDDVEKILLQYNPNLGIVDDYGARALEI